jgi:hypothetical protein
MGDSMATEELAEMMRACGVPAREFVVLDDTSGTTHRTRVLVRLVDGSTRVVFIKSPAVSMVARGVVGLSRLDRAEIGFYRDAASAVSAIVPQCLCAQASVGSFALVLDDLVARGADPYRLGDVVPIAAVEQALVSLAALHGTFWEDRRLTSVAWPWCRPFLPTGEASIGWLVAPALSALGRRRARRWIPDEVGRRLVQYALRRTPMLRRLDRGPRTLVHHDCHPGNLAQAPDGRVVLFDWQLVRAGPWASDVSYLLATSLPPDDRRAHEAQLIEHYLDALANAGGRPPAWAPAWRAYVINLVYPLEAMVVTLALGAMQPAAFVGPVVARAAAAVADHGAFAALASAP